MPIVSAGACSSPLGRKRVRRHRMLMKGAGLPRITPRGRRMGDAAPADGTGEHPAASIRAVSMFLRESADDGSGSIDPAATRTVAAVEVGVPVLIEALSGDRRFRTMAHAVRPDRLEGWHMLAQTRLVASARGNGGDQSAARAALVGRLDEGTDHEAQSRSERDIRSRQDAPKHTSS